VYVGDDRVVVVVNRRDRRTAERRLAAALRGAQPVAPPPVCPDCSAKRGANGLIHDVTCPLGVGYDQIQDDDRAWFLLRPGATVRRRPAHWAEIAEMRAVGLIPPIGEVFGDVIVMRITDDVRTKSFNELWVVPR
jgi:hypothetical protein